MTVINKDSTVSAKPGTMIKFSTCNGHWTENVLYWQVRVDTGVILVPIVQNARQSNGHILPVDVYSYIEFLDGDKVNEWEIVYPS